MRYGTIGTITFRIPSSIPNCQTNQNIYTNDQLGCLNDIQRMLIYVSYCTSRFM